MTKQEIKERIKIKANEYRLWDCLNEAIDLLSNNCTDIELKKKSKEIYQSKGYSPLPFFNQQKVFNNYLKK